MTAPQRQASGPPSDPPMHTRFNVPSIGQHKHACINRPAHQRHDTSIQECFQFPNGKESRVHFPEKLRQTIRSKKLLVTKGISTSSKNAISSSWHRY